MSGHTYLIPTSTDRAASQLPDNSEAPVTKRGSTYTTNQMPTTIKKVEQESGHPGIPPLKLFLSAVVVGDAR